MQYTKGGAGIITIIILAILLIVAGTWYFNTTSEERALIENTPENTTEEQSEENEPQTAAENPPVTQQQAQSASTCTPSTSPYITVTHPNGGEVFTAGNQITITWDTCNIASNYHTAVVLDDLSTQNTNQWDDIILESGQPGAQNTSNLNDGSMTRTIPTNTPSGTYKLKVIIENDDTTASNWSDASDDSFQIQ